MCYTTVYVLLHDKGPEEHDLGKMCQRSLS
jgi:hypothetical protein